MGMLETIASACGAGASFAAVGCAGTSQVALI
jgi:hypothetical protein